eukprot:825784-Amphidinium_carterae.1
MYAYKSECISWLAAHCTEQVRNVGVAPLSSALIYALSSNAVGVKDLLHSRRVSALSNAEQGRTNEA